MQKLKEKLEQEIKARKELEKLSKQIEITITPEGSAHRADRRQERNLLSERQRAPQRQRAGVAGAAGRGVEDAAEQSADRGHTDATQYSSDANYSNWELSADRANSARRLLQQDGVRSDQVTQVRGYADQLLRVKNNPYDPSNRRISILVKNREGPAAQLEGRGL